MSIHIQQELERSRKIRQQARVIRDHTRNLRQANFLLRYLLEKFYGKLQQFSAKVSK